jgi:BirA family biotin operon repressor/biotin-[acetyl-CoA-carboxylase] ligase
VSPHQLPLVSGLAVRNAAAELTGNDDIQLKWPNDVLFQGRKLAGLLCERVHKADLIGLGLNVNLDSATAPVPASLRERVASLSEVARRPVDVTHALSTVAARLYRMIGKLADQPFEQVLREYDVHHALVGRAVSVMDGADDTNLSGRCEGLDGMGRLLLRSRSGLHRVISGTVTASDSRNQRGPGA